jgi:H+/Cl- antiporter ClcA
VIQVISLDSEILTTQRRRAKVVLFIGALSAVVAYVLVWLIAVITNLAFYQRFSSVFQSPDHHRLGYLVILVPVIGGLIIGFMARYGSEKIRGHGIPEALEAILFGRSRMEPKVALLKPLSSAISIGTGGPFGAEGPIIMTGGAVGSIFAQFFHLSSAERKTLLVAGAAGGMAAIFASPVAAALLAIELLLFEWRRVPLFRWRSPPPRPPLFVSRFSGQGRSSPFTPTQCWVWRGWCLLSWSGLWRVLGRGC